VNYQDAALVLAGHGSTLNSESSTPTYLHADEIRRRGVFAEVHECFWKEEPHFRDVLRQVDSKRIYVVPNFISEGYFTENVIPRELSLTGRITNNEEREIYYCDPVGVHSRMTEVLLGRAETVLEGATIDLAETCLFIAGHGTSQNQNSTKIIYHQVELIRARKLYGECQAFFMEQPPLMKDWPDLTAKKNVIVVPFFISDGLHSFEDIPVLLEISNDMKKEGFRNPTEIKGRRLWYATALGSEPLIADVILDQVKFFDEHYGSVSA